MLYSQPLYRPPSEAYSAIIQATIGCSHNKCAFCSMYTNKKFQIRNWSDLKHHIDMVIKYNPLSEKVFIADGNALVMSTKYWIQILDYIKVNYPKVKQISAYATPKDLLHKNPDDLNLLHAHGLSLLYMGIESGNDEILLLINKGATSEEIILAGNKAIAAGFKLSVTIIAGLGGEEYYAHAYDTANLINKIQPQYIGMLALMLEEGSILYKKEKEGKFKLPSPKQFLQEARIFLQHTELKNSIFRSNHASNYLALSGTLNADKETLLHIVDHALNNPHVLKPENFRGL